MIQARDYQIEAVSSVWNYFETKTGNPLIAMPTGTGKSVVIAMLLHSIFAVYPGQRIMMLTHVKELIEQDYEKLIALWPFAPAGIYSAGLGRKEANSPITFAGIASVAKKAWLFGHIDIIIIDEAHLVSPDEQTQYHKFINELKKANKYLKCVGLTATPWRTGHGKLTDPVINEDGSETPSLFTDICFDLTTPECFNWLIAKGYLAPLIPKNTLTQLDVDGVRMQKGDFNQSQLQASVDKPDVTEAAIKEAMELGWDREHWLVFASGVEHAINTCDMMNAMGIPTVVIHSNMGTTERDDAIRDFKAGKYIAAVNNNILTTGFDFPAMDLILVLRPTTSVVLWVQMLGRGTRPSPGKANCLVLDFANNTRRLGPINDPLVPRKKGEGSGEAPVKECPKCKGWIHASLRFCNGVMNDGTNCTHEFIFEKKIQQGASTLDLIKGDMPVVECFAVDHITYDRFSKAGKPDMVRVSYYCGLRKFTEIVCPEHDNYARRKAQEWWSKRVDSGKCPDKVTEFLDQATKVQSPTHIRVWVNKKYPDIMAICFDGTAFGTIEPKAAPEKPKLEFALDNRDDTPF